MIFVSGQSEVNRLVRRLRKAFPLRPVRQKKHNPEVEDAEGSDEELQRSLNGIRKNKKKDNKNRGILNNIVLTYTFIYFIRNAPDLPNIDLDDYDLPGVEEDNESECDFDSDSEDDLSAEHLTKLGGNREPLWTLPLYSLLPTAKQARVRDYLIILTIVIDKRES